MARCLQTIRPVAVIDADQLGHQVLKFPNVQEQILQRFGPTVFETQFRPTDVCEGEAPAEPSVGESHGSAGASPSQATAFQISRTALGRLVFGSDVVAETARRDLEAIVWPEIRSLIERQVSELRGESNNLGGTSLSHRRACEAMSNDHALPDGQGVPPESEQRQANVEAIVLDAAVLLEAGWDDLCDAVVFIDTPEADRIARVQAGRGWSAEQLAEREASQWPLPRKRAAADAVIDNSNSVDDAARQLDQVIQNFGVR